ncbi:FHA domain-containing protein [Glaciecola sp. XM2]|uniref:FHA domain-containing protein n=1 Tax=Glaciecola sp. XM2 TaxID=1914931 RepID=UPI001BDE473C|nr:FHA domain-containing protein [Glaciecola sp. XM2]MBT1449405.1 FHA domain-containing protein [Glaciecola sp. XM2]
MPAKEWQLMLVPQQTSSQQNAQLQSQYAKVIEQALAYQLTQSSSTVLHAQSVFGQCTEALCGAESLSDAMQLIANKAEHVELVLLYGISDTTPAMLSVEMIDPVSLEFYDAFNLPLLNSDTQRISLAQIRSLSGDLGTVVANRLREIVKKKSFKLVLQGFTLDEVAPFSIYFMSQTNQSELRLTKSEKVDSWMSKYFPIVETHFMASTAATETQFNQLLDRFFKESDIEALIEFDSATQQFLVSRIGNPYAPSLFSRFLMLLALGALLVLIVKRQIYHFQLERYADKKSADQWLDVYAKAKSPWFVLRSKWGNQFSYWQRLQRESQELEKQAQLFFDAGDVISAKLFVSKALNLNADAQMASALITKINHQESSQKALSDKEQWVRNKVAKAMNNYRGNQPIKALRQAYQALASIKGEKQLKRQYKAIKRLIQKVNNDFSETYDHIELTDLDNGDTCVLTTAAQVDIGRFSSKDMRLSLATGTLPLYINHKALSRAGKHLTIQKHANGFYMMDQGSTNGSFVSDETLSSQEPRLVVNGDNIKLGADSELTAVKLLAQVDDDHSVLRLRVSNQLTQTLDIADLARVWPDYMHAMRTSLLMTASEAVLAHERSSGEIRLISRSQLKQSDDYIEVLSLTLGKGAKVKPLSEEPMGETLYLNDELLLGMVPLILPCEIKWGKHHVYLDDYADFNGLEERQQEARFFLRASDADDTVSPS